MKRRTFVRSAALGAFGLSITPGFSKTPFLQTDGVEQWLQRFRAATAAKKRSIAVSAPESFQQLTDTLDARFAKRGFLRKDSDFYFYATSESCCFYALQLRHPASGLRDMLLPVLTREQDGSWRHFATITGYQLEALARAADVFPAHTSPLQELLLPVPGKPARTFTGFNSKASSISITTRLTAGKAETSISITDQGQVLYKDTFESRHCLTFSPVAI